MKFELLILSSFVLADAFHFPWESISYLDTTADRYDSDDRCGMVGIPASHINDREMLDTCITVCRTEGEDAAAHMGCLSPLEAVSSIFYTGDGILDWSREKTYMASYTPADCANDCYKDKSCVYWQYGPALDSTTSEVDTARVQCGHAAIGDFADIVDVGYMGLDHDEDSGPVKQAVCGDIYLNFFNRISSYWTNDVLRKRAASRIGSFLNRKLIQDNCDLVLATTTSTTTTTTTDTTAAPKTTPITVLPTTAGASKRDKTENSVSAPTESTPVPFSRKTRVTRSVHTTSVGSEATAPKDSEITSTNSLATHGHSDSIPNSIPASDACRTTEAPCDTTTRPCRKPGCGAGVDVAVHIELN